MSSQGGTGPEQVAGDERAAKDFARVLRGLVGKPLLFHISTPISGVMLELGERVRLARPVDNPRLSAEQREFEGDSNVFITCTWWLDAPDGVIPSRGELDDLAWWEVQLAILVGHTVEQVTSTADRRQLQIQFDNNVWIVADLARSQEHQEYSIRRGREYWTVSADGRLRYFKGRGA